LDPRDSNHDMGNHGKLWETWCYFVGVFLFCFFIHLFI
jgi:hypothetical protein